MGQRNQLLGNFISLSFVQGITILFPLITFPYLLRVLGVAGFGIFTMIQTFIMYFDLFVSFGFGLTATKHISFHKHNIAGIKRVVAAAYIIKLLLFIVSVTVFIICSLFIPYLRENILIALTSSLYLLGNLLLPDWYFQGIQKMRNISIVVFISKFASLFFMILLVKENTDIVYAVLSLSAGNFIAGLTGFIIMARALSFQTKWPGKSFLISIFKESAYVFTSIILAPLYSSVNIFILQVFTNPLIVGYYAISEKIFTALGMLTSVANRTFYPHLSRLYHESAVLYERNVQSIVKMFLLVFSVLAVIQFFAAEQIIRVITGKNYKEDISYAISILKIMSIGLIYSPFVSFFFQLLIIQGQKKRAMVNIIIAVSLNLATGCFLSFFFSGKGMAVNLCIIVFIIAALNYYSFYKNKNSLPLPG
jgi:PST family polysaccharide transporter